MCEFKLVRCSDGQEMTKFSVVGECEVLLKISGDIVKKRLLRTTEFVTTHQAICDAYRMTYGADFGYNA